MPAALVTGGAARLGRAMALYLADRGYDIAVHYNGSADQAAAVVDEITAKGIKANQRIAIEHGRPEIDH